MWMGTMIQILPPLELVSHLLELSALENQVTKALGCLPMMLSRMLSFLLEIAPLYRVLGFLTGTPIYESIFRYCILMLVFAVRI
jgi:hypothetical protein